MDCLCYIQLQMFGVQPSGVGILHNLREYA